ncbi:MAG: biotin--[acetyl-CoA-carboxylase] ligase, partial [Candidatus Udaeobacter sp.]
MVPAEILDRLVAEELEGHFPCATIGRRIIVLEQTTSTNDAILQVPTANSDAGLVLFAEHQTAGRGQRGNRWEAAAGKGLWFSILLRPK